MGVYLNRETAGYALALVVIGFALYAPSLNNRFILDDEELILKNPFIQEVTWTNVEAWFTENMYAGAGRVSDYYRPVLLASFSLNHAFGGGNPFGYHLINNLLHITNGFLVFCLILYCLRRKTIAFLVALVFVIHPVQSENVVFIASRGDLLASFFMLLGLLVWLYGVESRRRLVAYGLASVCLIAALLSRENAIIWPFLVVVAYVAFCEQGNIWRLTRTALGWLLPHIGIVLGYLTLRLTVLNFRDFLNFGNYEPTSLYHHDLFVRLYTFLPVLAEYVRTIVWPTNVHERFTFPTYHSFFDLSVWPVFLLLVLLLVLLVWLYRGKKMDFKIWLFASGWFFVALIPAIGIIPTPQVIQDHRLYLALIGVAVLVGYYMQEGFAYLQANGFGWVRAPVLVFFALYFGFISIITIQRSIIWGKPIELLEETLRYEPDALIAYNSLGKYYLDAREYQKAEQNFLEAIRRGTTSALPYFNLGLVYEIGSQPDFAKAEFFYREALARDPNYERALRRLHDLGTAPQP